MADQRLLHLYAAAFGVGCGRLPFKPRLSEYASLLR